MSRWFLGLDSSTQSLTAILIDPDARAIVAERSLNFDTELPEYGTRNGVLRAADPTVVHAPPLMWAAALDRMFERLVSEGLALSNVAAVAVSGQQHGSVYLTAGAPAALAELDPAKGLAASLRPVLARATSPIWMDSSTSVECDEITAALGGAAAVARRTGSAAFERFTGPQIRKFWKTDPAGYARTAHIALVSSFIPSILAGRIAPIDPGDGAGMNLMDIATKRWDPAALEATAPDLARRLPPIVPSHTVVGPVSPYFVRRYGFSPSAQIVVGSGDNPCSLVGLGLVRAGMVAISLGTSDTYFGAMDHCRVSERGEGHVFGSPTGGYMTLVCFKNGSLARERVRDELGLDWAGFSRAIRETPPALDGRALVLPWYEPEITPRVLKPGVWRRGIQPGDPAMCRAVVEAQMMAMRIHTRWMGIRPACIYATGGASANTEILQIMADVHACPVHRFETTASAALGAALRAYHAAEMAAGRSPDWTQIVHGFAEPVAGSRVDPKPEAIAAYDAMESAYVAFEQEALKTAGA
ncbi:MAG: FGGY-family carbohydrate kinase [Kiritimatiellae bacterium]|nr:FGGY-family carbohydrate kinase [Kiritimatiellia bacterium]